MKKFFMNSYIFPVCLILVQIVILVIIYLSIDHATSSAVFLCCLGVTVMTILFNGVFLCFLHVQNKRELLDRQIQKQEFRQQINQKKILSDQEIENDRKRLVSSLNQQLHKAVEVSEKMQRDFRVSDYSQLSSPFTWDSRQCENVIADIILKEKVKECENSKIDFKVNAMIPEQMNIEDYHLCSLLTNLLDNAVEACMDLSEQQRHIEFYASVQAAYFVIHLENSTRESYVKRPRRLGHGWGTEIVRDIVDRYGGHVRNEFRDGRFITDIVVEAF